MKIIGIFIYIAGWAIIANYITEWTINTNHMPIKYCLIGAACIIIGDIIQDVYDKEEE